MIRFVAALLVLFGLTISPLHAQTPGGNNSGNPVTQKGVIIPTDCAQWAGPGVIQDSGAGCGGGGGSGTVTSIATGCQATGGTITTTGTISTAEIVNAQTGAGYTLNATDCGKLVTLSNASAETLSIPQAGTTGFASGYFADVCNIGAGTWTLTPTTSTLTGPQTLFTSQCTRLISDGTNWQQAGYLLNAAALTAGTLAQARYTIGTSTPTTGITSGNLLGSSSNLTTDSGVPYSGGHIAAAGMPALTGYCTTIAGAVATICDVPQPGYVTSNWYFPYGPTPFAATGSGAEAANVISCYWVYFPKTVTVEALGVSVRTASSSNIQVALYTVSGGLPGALLSKTGNLSDAAQTWASGALGTNQQIGPGGSAADGNIYICTNANDSTVVLEAYGLASSGALSLGQIAGGAALTNLLPNNSSSATLRYTCSGANCNGGSSTFNTWPSSLSGSTWTANNTLSAPLVAFQVASSP
jgi:hypothetical protein